MKQGAGISGTQDIPAFTQVAEVYRRLAGVLGLEERCKYCSKAFSAHPIGENDSQAKAGEQDTHIRDVYLLL
jgi:hypothetical protein